MDIPDPISASYGTRLSYRENSQSFFPFGNTPAKDLLEYAKTTQRKPSILLLGFDDLRSVFYTIWKNFHPKFHHRFEGVHFHLNDSSPAVLARNILLLYLCIKLPQDRASRQKWLMAMWSVWFCHEVLPDHERVLRGALKMILELAEVWDSSDNPLNRFVECSPTALRGAKKFWTMWSNNKATDSSKVLKNLRQRELVKLRGGVLGEATIGLFDLTGTMGMTLHKNIMEVMRDEYKTYLEVGSVYAEELLEKPLALPKKRSVNVTMFETFGEYRIYYTQCPYRCFHQVHICSVSKMALVRMHVTDYDKKNSYINSEEVFTKHPLLANSFQQFSLWTICSSEVLLSCQNPVRLCFSSIDPFLLPRTIKQRFDLVYASNIIDHEAPPAFILACTKLLKETGLFLCGSVLHKEFAPTLEGYLEFNFGFSCKYLPVICGLRCYNQEGKDYASTTSTEHLCVDPGDADPKQSSMKERVFIWEKVDMTHLEIVSLSDCPELCGALADCFNFCCNTLTRHPLGRNLSNLLCTGTAMDVLETFASKLDAKLVKSYAFWESLCTDISRREGMSLYLASIQTQALLRGIHLHIAVGPDICPMCTDKPMSEYLGQFFLEVPLNKVSNTLPIITIFISQKPIEVPESDDDVLFLFAFTKAMQEYRAHNIDCITGEIKKGYFRMSFVAPRDLAIPMSCYTLNEFILVQGTGGKIRNRTNVLRHGKISNCLTTLAVSPKPKLSTLTLTTQTFSIGTIIKHSGSGDHFETVLSLADDKPELLKEKLAVNQLSPSKIKTTCADHSFEVMYPFPIVYGKLSLQRSKKTKTLTLKAYRRQHLYAEDTQLFYVNPEDHFSFPSLLPNSRTLEMFTQKQFATKLKLFKPIEVDLTFPLLAVEHCIKAMLTLTDQMLFFMISELNDEKVYGVFEVLHRAVDVHRKVPVIHLFLCFVESLPQEKVALMASLMGPHCEIRKSFVTRLQVAKHSFDQIELIFRNFARHTVQTGHLRPRYIPDMVLPFSSNSCCQAIVYPLYEEPTRAAASLRCSACSSLLTTKGVCKCPCREAWYCSSECQEKHSREHNKVCRLLKGGTAQFAKVHTEMPVEDKCAYCGKKSVNLKACSKCRKTMYCDRECQRSHWKVTHRFDCARLLAEEENRPRCGVCHQITNLLVKCEHCHLVSCSKLCLEKHSFEHKSETLESTSKTSKDEKLLKCDVCHQPTNNISERCKECLESHESCKQEPKAPDFNPPQTSEPIPVSEEEKADTPSLQTDLPFSRPSPLFPLTDPPFQSDLSSSQIDQPFPQTDQPSPQTDLPSLQTDLPSPQTGLPTNPTSPQNDTSISESTGGESPAKVKRKYPSKGFSKERSGVKTGPCGYCGSRSSKPSRCARCHQVLYCGPECQKAHWKEHKLVCKS